MSNPYLIVCPICETTFESLHSFQKYCSSICRHKSINRRYKVRNGITRATSSRKKNRAKGLCHCGNAVLAGRARCVKCAEQTKTMLRILRQSVINGYGRLCECCGEDQCEFLTIDHVNNDGKDERKKSNFAAASLHRQIKAENFPPRYRLLCYNCNIGRYKNGGVCPHEEARLALVA